MEEIMDFTWNLESLLIDILYKQEMNQLVPLYRQERTNLICFYLSIIVKWRTAVSSMNCLLSHY